MKKAYYCKTKPIVELCIMYMLIVKLVNLLVFCTCHYTLSHEKHQ